MWDNFGSYHSNTRNMVKIKRRWELGRVALLPPASVTTGEARGLANQREKLVQVVIWSPKSIPCLQTHKQKTGSHCISNCISKLYLQIVSPNNINPRADAT